MILIFVSSQNKGNVCLGILNGSEVGLGAVNIIGGMTKRGTFRFVLFKIFEVVFSQENIQQKNTHNQHLSEEKHISIEIVVHILTFFPHFLWVCLCRYFYVRQNGDLRQRKTADWMGSRKLQQASIVVLVGRPNIRLSCLFILLLLRISLDTIFVLVLTEYINDYSENFGDIP